MDAIRDILLPALTAKHLKWRHQGGKWAAQCPAHDDNNPSLSIEAGRTQPVVLTCHYGCRGDKILEALGLTWAELCAPREDKPNGDWTPFGDAIAVYDYRDEKGVLLYQVCRTADKQFPVRVPDGSKKTGYRWKLGDTRRVLYRLEQVIAAVEQCRTIYICEGEKDVHTLEAQGLVATCNPGGAGSGWRPEYNIHLQDAVVWIIADADDKGRAHARTVRQQLEGVAADITVAEAAAGKDATDHFTAGKTLDDLLITWPTVRPSDADLAIELWQFLDGTDPAYDWVIPDLLERGDRLILTGWEGLGKSMLVRQLAVAAAAGLHPFNTGYAHRYPPKRVLFIDCENSETQSRRKLRGIAMHTKQLDAAVPPGQMRLIHRPEGIDLTTVEDAAWLLERITAHRPDILIIGPFYRLHAGNMNDEQIARRTVAVLDAARAAAGCALITEAHAGHGEPGKTRSVRPTGSSLLLRWPEFGYGLAGAEHSTANERGIFTEVDVKAWRGDRDARDWPMHLRYGGPNSFPWVPWKPAGRT